MRAFVLTSVAVGKEKDFFSRLSEVPQVLHVYFLFGRHEHLLEGKYEYLLEVEGPSYEDLARVLRERIRRIPGVERTVTFVEGNTEMFSPVARDQRPESPQTLF